MAATLTRVLCVFGTRPEAIKMAPVVRALARDGRGVRAGRRGHRPAPRDARPGAATLFGIGPDHDLDLMRPDQTLAELTARVLDAARPELLAESGPTGGRAGRHHDGVGRRARRVLPRDPGRPRRGRAAHRRPSRTRSRRRSTAGSPAQLADLHFAPTDAAARQPAARGRSPASDRRHRQHRHRRAAHDVAARPFDPAAPRSAALPRRRGRLVLVTAHRRENFGRSRCERSCAALRRPRRGAAATSRSSSRCTPTRTCSEVVRPTARRRRPSVLRHRAARLPRASSRCCAAAHLILTDSGGVQEEAPSLGKPVLVMRDNTERPEAVEAGTVRLVGTDGDRDRRPRPHAGCSTTRGLRARWRGRSNPYGDGRAAERIADAIEARS